MNERRGLSDKSALVLLGGFKRDYIVNKVHFYELNNGALIAIKYSKLYDDGVGYWFGISPGTLEVYKNQRITNLVLILGYEGIAILQSETLYEYLKKADITYKNGHIDHYHMRIRYDEDIILYNSEHKYKISDDYYRYDEKVVNAELNSKSIAEILEEANKFNDYNEPYSVSEKTSRRRKESKAQKERIAIIENHTCQVCGFHEEYLNSSGETAWIIEVDHIIDKALGGGENVSNLWVLCPNCHEKKTRGIIIIDPIAKRVTERGIPINMRDNHLKWGN